MRFCNECGTQLAAEAAFCNECGSSINNNSVPVERNERGQIGHGHPQDNLNGGSHGPVTPTAPKQPMSKKTKIVLFSSIVSIVLLIGIHFVLQNIFSPERMIDKFEQALIDQDAKAIANLLSSDDKRLEIDEAAVSGFINYFEKNPDLINPIVSRLHEQMVILDNQGQFGQDGMPITSGMVSLEYDGKFLFYEKYKLTVPSVYVEVYTNYEDTTLFVDEKEVGQADTEDFSDTYGPFVPGLHTLKGTLKTDYVDLSTEKEILIDGYSNKVSTELYLDGDELTFDFGEYDGTARLFINGNEIDKDLIEDPTFGPVLVDGSMSYSIQAELPWGTVKTDELPIDKTYIEVNFLNENLKDTIMNTVHTFNAERLILRTSADETKLTTGTQDVKNELLENALYDQEHGYAISAKLQSTTVNLDSFSIFYNSSKDYWYVQVTARSLWEYDYYDVESGTNGLEPLTADYEYELVYDEVQGKWLVSYVGSPWAFYDENVKTITVEEPVLYTSEWVK